MPEPPTTHWDRNSMSGHQAKLVPNPVAEGTREAGDITASAVVVSCFGEVDRVLKGGRAACTSQSVACLKVTKSN
jgi:hypothetical protein